MNSSATVTFHSGVGSVTGANFLLETNKGTKVLVDCGLVQGERVAMQENHLPFAYDRSSIQALIITHAHLDHVGRIPKLVKEGYTGPIYSTPETRELAELVLNDAVSILAMEARQNNTDPIYEIEDVQAVFAAWKTFPYHEAFTIGEDVSITLKDAGHILGSAMIEATVDGKTKILFTGDLGNSPAPLLRDSEPIEDVDYLVMESVYGDRNHESREQRLNVLEKAVKDTISRGGTLVIPAFSLDRTQVLLYELNNMVEEKRIPSVPVYVDSPMATKATEAYRAGSHLFNDKVREQMKNGDDIFHFPRLQYTISQNESRDIEHMKGAKIILAGSGMSVGGRVVAHEEKYLPDAVNTILLVGYQSTGSLGRRLADGAKKVSIHGREVVVKAHVETLYGYSAHRDMDHLMEFVSTGTKRLKKVFVVMGEPSASMHLAQKINDEFGVKALFPERDKPYELS
jgi:metallo-beta-lactamase family protein